MLTCVVSFGIQYIWFYRSGMFRADDVTVLWWRQIALSL